MMKKRWNIFPVESEWENRRWMGRKEFSFWPMFDLVILTDLWSILTGRVRNVSKNGKWKVWPIRCKHEEMRKMGSTDRARGACSNFNHQAGGWPTDRPTDQGQPFVAWRSMFKVSIAKVGREGTAFWKAWISFVVHGLFGWNIECYSHVSWLDWPVFTELTTRPEHSFVRCYYDCMAMLIG